MCMKLILGFLVCIFLTGCQTVKSKNQIMLLPAVKESNSKVNEEKFWVEAETNKIWVNPHVDENGELVDGHYKYVVVIPGHWAVENGKREQK